MRSPELATAFVPNNANQHSRPDCDVLIAGGGPVGATLAIALRGHGLAVALVEPAVKPSSAFRPIALAHGSRLILDRLGVFDAARYTPINAIHVSQAGGFGRTLIRSEDEGVPALGYVRDAGELAADLLARAAPERIAGRVTGWQEERDCVRVTIDATDGQRHAHARLLVLADGVQHAGDDLALRDYGQSAIVARVRTENVRRGFAFERFTSDGPLALLPLGEEFALVWTVRNTQANDLIKSSGEHFLAALGARFGARLGRFVAAGPRATYPLKLWFRRSSSLSARAVAVGNAAQTLHPVAGQGLNLGLRDARELADLILRTGADAIGGGDFAAALQAQRRCDRGAAIGATDWLVRVFSNDYGWLRAARGAGLVALDVFPPARRLLARRMMLGARGLP